LALFAGEEAEELVSELQDVRVFGGELGLIIPI
jgi:hypothetical protein